MIGKLSTIESARVNVVPEDWEGFGVLKAPTRESLERLMDDALEFCSLRAKKQVPEIIEKIKKDDLWANSTLRYALAKEIGKTLSKDSNFRDLYIQGSVMEDRARMTSDIDLILHVKGEKSNFETWIVALDDGLVQMFHDLFGLREGFRSLLDCHVVTDEDVSRKSGYGALLTTIHSSLTRLR